MHREEGKQLKWYGCIMEMQEMDGQKAYIIWHHHNLGWEDDQENCRNKNFAKCVW
jgi:hypothetical protein